MKRALSAAVLIAACPTAFSRPIDPQMCIDCHRKATPGIVTDSELSKHSKSGVGCETCHGDNHVTTIDVANVKIPTPETCGTCHEQQLVQFRGGKHAAAWAAQEAMPTIHWQPMELIDGMKGCGGCHKIGLKSEAATVGWVPLSGRTGQCTGGSSLRSADYNAVFSFGLRYS